MSRKKMVEGIMRHAGISKANVERFYEGLSSLIKAELARSGRFVLPGIGAFVVRRRKARTARNPRTGQPVHVPARKVVRFKAFSSLNELLNGPREKKPTLQGQPEISLDLPLDDTPKNSDSQLGET